MGPTASGKTELALRLADALPLDIVSVDSALVYRGMDIGTAKPDQETLLRYPHRLLDIREPEDSYSAGDFVRDATAAMTEIRAAGRVPLLAGGTMMYFRALTRGIAQLPQADRDIRAAIDAEAAAKGWPALHRELAAVDRTAADRINPNDSQRIQRALEVYRTSGRTITEWHRNGKADRDAPVRFLKFGLIPPARSTLHSRIEKRLAKMLEDGFLDEVRRLRQRPGLSARSPSMRSVGYRQLWSHLDGECDLETAVARARAATRQLAKRQLTWLRSESGLCALDPLEPGTIDTIVTSVEARIGRGTAQ
ncbi:MAG TPA: tRNA (adenosine(37)-N6)-dimethylallyltransferase MiaA [Woeseiaceae bacterium]|nr:tRNA (adenosine(37)-N6)-dimethylallyltransferase MiaA [Woeseiaceae bacterium]